MVISKIRAAEHFCEFMQNHNMLAHEYMTDDTCESAHMCRRFPVAYSGKYEPTRGSFSEMHDNEQGARNCTFCELKQNYNASAQDYMTNEVCEPAHIRGRFPVAPARAKMDL